MGRRRKFGRPVDGVLILDKPLGMSSNAALQEAKRLFFAQKAGHTGSLDPLATGVLPLCFGESTKFSQQLLDADKGYRARIQLGVATTTGDLEGEVIGTSNTEQVTEATLDEVIDRFRGKVEQVPSMFSALKYQGTPLYELARKGVDVERPPRTITIHKLEILDFTLGSEASIDVEVVCSKGTYIRTLAEDIGIALGVGAHLTQLHRISAGIFDDSQSYTLDRLKELRGEQPAESLDEFLLPVDALLKGFSKVELDNQSAEFFILGQAVMVPGVYRSSKETDIVRTFRETGEFLGIGEVTEDGRVRPRRLIVQDQN